MMNCYLHFSYRKGRRRTDLVMNSHLIPHYEPLQLHHTRITEAQAAPHPSITKGISHKHKHNRSKHQRVVCYYPWNLWIPERLMLFCKGAQIVRLAWFPREHCTQWTYPPRCLKELLGLHKLAYSHHMPHQPPKELQICCYKTEILIQINLKMRSLKNASLYKPHT